MLRWCTTTTCSNLQLYAKEILTLTEVLARNGWDTAKKPHIKYTHTFDHSCRLKALIHSRIAHKRGLTLSCYRYINREKQRKREREKNTGILLAYHISLCFSPVVGQLLVCIHTAGHHIAMLQFSGQFELFAICSMDGIWWGQMSVNTEFSELQVKGRLVKVLGLKSELNNYVCVIPEILFYFLPLHPRVCIPSCQTTPARGCGGRLSLIAQWATIRCPRSSVFAAE